MKKKTVKSKVAKRPEGQAPPEPKDLVKYKSRDGQQIRLTFDIVRRFLVSGKSGMVSDGEILFYMAQCKAKGLNPFKRDCYLVKYTEDDPAATIVSIDYFRARANAQQDCMGWTGGIIVKTQDGAIINRNGSFMEDGAILLGGWFKAKKKGWDIEREWTVPLEPYIQRKKDGSPNHFWQGKRQQEQIAKVCESQGLRRVWPDEFDKLYIREEIIPDYTQTDVGSVADTLPMPAAIDSDPGKSTDRKPPPAIAVGTVPEKPSQKIDSKPSKINNGDGLEKEVRDMIAAVITADDLKSSAISIDKKMAGVKDRDALLALCREWNLKKQSVARSRK